MWHEDRDARSALEQLNDALCSLERSTGREYTLMFIPHCIDERCVLSRNGKPLPVNVGPMTQEILDFAMKERFEMKARRD